MFVPVACKPLVTGAEGGVEAHERQVGVKQEDGPYQALRDQQVNRIAGAGRVPGEKNIFGVQ